MSDNSESWKWVDEDPIDRLLQRPDRTGAGPASGMTAVSLIAEGGARFARLEFEEAARAYTAVIAADAGHPTAHFDLAVCLEKMEQWKAAADSFRRALEIDPERWQALVGLGACLLHLDDADEALTCFETCLERAVSPEVALLGKGASLQKLGRRYEAGVAYRELLEIAPDSVDPLANMIALSVEREDLSAIAHYSSLLLKIHPQSKAALQGMAMLAIHNGDQAAAVDYCSQLVETDPDSFEGRFNLRFAQQRMRQAERSARSIA